MNRKASKALKLLAKVETAGLDPKMTRKMYKKYKRMYARGELQDKIADAIV